MSHPRAVAQRKPGTPLHSVLGGTLRQTFPVTPHGVQTWEKHQRRTNDQIYLTLMAIMWLNFTNSRWGVKLNLLDSDSSTVLPN